MNVRRNVPTPTKMSPLVGGVAKTVIGEGNLGGDNNEPFLAPDLIEPIGNEVLVQLIPVSQTKGHIHLPDSASVDAAGTPEALVVSTGPYCQQVHRGDRVLVLQIQRTAPINYQEHQLWYLTEERIAGIVNESYDVRANRCHLTSEGYMALRIEEDRMRAKYRSKFVPRKEGE